MTNRLLICTLALSLAGSVVAFTDPGAAAVAKPVTSHGSVPLTRQHAPKLSAATLAAGRAAVPAPTAADTTVIAHLDPSLNAAAGVAGAQADPSAPVAGDGTVAVIADGPDVVAAARRVGATVGTLLGGQVTLRVPADRLRTLAAQPGVTGVHSPVPAVTTAAQDTGVQSEGVASSGAQAWNAVGLGNGGQGVNIAIVDAGFGGLSDEISAGHLGPASQVVADSTPGSAGHVTANMCGSNYASSDHGTAVAEIAHQMAPNATLYLYCVSDSSGFVDVVNLILDHNASAGPADQIKIASSSLDFPGEARGDGYTAGPSTQVAVRAARQHGILWIQSAGNSAEDHWTGTFSDKYGYVGGVQKAVPDNWVDLDVQTVNGKPDLTESDSVVLEPGTSGSATLTWDQWPTSKSLLQLVVQEYDVTSPQCQQTACLINTSFAVHGAGAAPSLRVGFDNQSNDEHVYGIMIQYLAANSKTAVVPPPAVRYDLTMDGAVSPDYLSGLDPARAAGGSIGSPASSPWALAVGAVYAGNTNGPNASNAGNIPANSLETFSSRGPTIDGRVKPDLVAYDGVSSNISDVTSPQLEYDSNGNSSIIDGTTGFYGTSAAAPHVAGAAALVLAVNPAMDASQLEAFLEAPNYNDPSLTQSPADNTDGHGRLVLGPTNANQVSLSDASKVVPANGSRYHLFAQAQRIADTRSGLGVPAGALTTGREVTVPVPTSGPDAVPADATSVVVSVSGTAARGGTYLSIYPRTWPGNSTLNLSATDPNASVTSIVRMDPSTHSFMLRNAAAATDAIVTLLGYFGSSAETTDGDGYTALAPSRVLDTRNAIGGPTRKLTPGQAVTVDTTSAGVPAGADVVAVTIQALNQTASGQLTAFPNANPAVSSVDYTKYPRGNLVLVPVVNGRFTLLNRYASTDALVDVSGYFSPDSTSRFVTLDSPVRFVDTRTGNGGRYAAMGANTTVTEDGGGLYGVPYTATALWVGMTAIASAPGFASIYPAGQAFPHASNLYYTALRSVPDSAIATLSAGNPGSVPPQVATVVRSGSINLLEDNYGYFVTPPTASASNR